MLTLKVITETSKKFLISVQPKDTINTLLTTIKKYYTTYFRKKYLIEFILTPDKFIILEDMEVSAFYVNGDLCFVQGKEGHLDEEVGNVKLRINYDVVHRKEGVENNSNSKKCIRNYNVKGMSPVTKNKDGKTAIPCGTELSGDGTVARSKLPKILSSNSLKGSKGPCEAEKKHDFAANAQHKLKNDTSKITVNDANNFDNNLVRKQVKEPENLFKTENINKHSTKTEHVDVKDFRQIRKKQKINYEDL